MGKVAAMTKQISFGLTALCLWTVQTDLEFAVLCRSILSPPSPSAFLTTAHLIFHPGMARQIDLHQIWQKQPKPKSRNQLSPRAGSISALEIFPFAKLKICETPSFASRLYFVGNYSLGIIKLKLFTNITKLWLGTATFRFIGRRPIIISQFCETITIRVHTVYWQPSATGKIYHAGVSLNWLNKYISLWYNCNLFSGVFTFSSSTLRLTGIKEWVIGWKTLQLWYLLKRVRFGIRVWSRNVKVSQ